jgi:hypothetical protein
MKSIVEEALSRHKSFEAHEESPDAKVHVRDTRVDTELREILSKLRTNIRIVGCGGGGCNTVSRISEEGIHGAELYATNTDAQHLLAIQSPRKILLGKRATRGLGAGALPMVGEEAARESREELAKSLAGSRWNRYRWSRGHLQGGEGLWCPGRCYRDSPIQRRRKDEDGERRVGSGKVEEDCRHGGVRSQ